MNSFEKYPELIKYIDNINEINNTAPIIAGMINNSQLIESNKIFDIAIIDRTINLKFAILNSISNWNIVAVGALLRVLLDNLIVSVYVLKNDRKDVLSKMYLERGRLYNSEGLKPIRESEMKKFVCKFIKGIDKIYEDTSGYIHFSNKYYSSSLSNPDELLFKIGLGNNKWPKENIENILKTIEIIIFNIFKTINDDLVVINNNLNR